jgi:hypothetical protein
VIALGRITAEQCASWRARPWGRLRRAVYRLSQLPTHAILGPEAEFARPAWSSIRATAWDAGRLPVAA